MIPGPGSSPFCSGGTQSPPLMISVVCESLCNHGERSCRSSPSTAEISHLFLSSFPVSQPVNYPSEDFLCESFSGRKLGECCLNVLVRLNENSGVNFSTFWRKSIFSSPPPLFFFVRLWLFSPVRVKLPVTIFVPGSSLS